MTWRRRRQKVGGLEEEFLIDTHGGWFRGFSRGKPGPGSINAGRAACGSAGSSAIWDGRGNSRWPRADCPRSSARPDPWAAAGNGRSRDARARRARSRFADRRASAHRPERCTRSAPGLRAHADPVDGARHRQACRWSRWRSRSRRHAAPSISASSTCSIGSPPVSTTKGGVPPLPRQASRQAAASASASANLPPPVAVGADEVGVAEIAGRRLAVCLAARPQIAAGKAAEHRRPPGLRAFALQRVEDLLDRIHGRSIQPEAVRDAVLAARPCHCS